MTATGGRRGRLDRRWWLALLLIAVAGCVGRAWNLDFDDRQHLHPDERHWSLTSAALAAADAPPAHGTVFGPLLDWLDGGRSPANPYRVADSFVYGPVTLAAGRAAAGWLHDGAVGGAQPAASVVAALDRLGVPLLTADGDPRFDDGYQVDLVGRLLGVLADTLAIVVIGIAGRRLGGPVVGLCAAAVHAASVLAIQHAHFFGSEPLLGLVAALLVAALVGLDRSPRIAAAVRGGGAVGALAGALIAVKLSGVGLAATAGCALIAVAVVNRRRADVVRLAAAAVAAMVAIRVLLPGAFVGLGLRLDGDFLADVRMLRRLATVDMPPAIQWADRVPVLEVGGWLVRSTIGPGAAAAAVVGAVALWRRRAECGRLPVAALLGAVPITWLTVLRGGVTTSRYFVPLLPVVALLAGYGFVATWTVLRRATPARRRVGTAVLTAAALAVVVWPVAFVSGVYGNEHTRVTASRWIAEHVPAGSALTHEAWDDALPLGITGVDPSAYTRVQLDLFGVDTPEKVELLAERLTTVDYVVESSPRVWNTVVRLPARFPSTINFFAALDDGRLGFERVATFTSPPRLGPWRFDSNAVEEAFSVYDHPEVRIWQRVRSLTVGELRAVLDPQAAAAAVHVAPRDAAGNGGLLTAEERAANATAPAHDQAFVTGGVAGSTVVQLLGWLLVTVMIGLAAWVLALPALGRLPDAGAGIAPTVGLVLVVAATVIAAGLGARLGQALVSTLVAALFVGAAAAAVRNRAAVTAAVRGNGRTIAAAVATSVGGGAVALLVRAGNPDLWHSHRGGEKPFELAMLTAVLRARTLPPPDTWFAGGALNYYYGGSLLVATPARLLGTSPSLAMNLGIGLVGMLTAGAAFGLGAAAWAARPGPHADAARRGAALAGVVAAVGVAVVPNPATAAAVLRYFAGGARGAFDWWAPSRVVPDSPVITEYPAWSFVFGDLHAHVIGLPVMLVVVTLLFGWLAAVAAADDRRVQPRLLVAATLLGVAVGAVRAVNTWDLPGVAAMVLIVTALSAALVRRRRETWFALGLSGVVALAAAVLPWLPFTRRFVVAEGGLDPVVDPTPLLSAAAQFAFWAVLTAIAIGAVLVDPAATRALSRLRWIVAVAAIVATSAVAVVADRVVLAGAVLLALGAVCAAVIAAGADGGARGPRSVPAGACALLALGWAAVAVIETVSIGNDFDRMNTVFKGWFQAWALLAVGGAGVVVWLLRVTWRRAGIAVLGVGATMVLLFVAVLVPARLDDRTSAGGLSLDGAAFVAAGAEPDAPEWVAAVAADWPLIEWFRAHVVGFPTVAEAPGRGYTWTARVATHAGMPTVIGWPHHQSQQRRHDGAEIGRRVADLTALYTGGDPTTALEVLWRYDVRYLVFGAAERELVATVSGSAEAAGASAAAVRALPCTTEVFAHADTFVLAVDQPCVTSVLFESDDAPVHTTN